jgi:hypothetical protein
METVRNGRSVPKAQVATEYLIVVSFALMVLIPYVLYLMQVSTSFQQDNSLDVASATVQKLGQTADWVYSQGSPSRLELSLTIPQGVQNITFNGKTMTWKVKSGSGYSDIYYNSVARLNGSLPTSPGDYRVLVTAMDSYVNISLGHG